MDSNAFLGSEFMQHAIRSVTNQLFEPVLVERLDGYDSIAPEHTARGYKLRAAYIGEEETTSTGLLITVPDECCLILVTVTGKRVLLEGTNRTSLCFKREDTGHIAEGKELGHLLLYKLSPAYNLTVQPFTT